MKLIIHYFIVAFLAMGTSLSAQEADDIIADYIKAIGGQKKLTALASLTTIGENTGPFGTSKMTMMKKAPNMNKMVINAMGNEMIFSYDGETAWAVNPWQGGGTPTKLEGDQAKAVPQEDLEDPFINYADKGHMVKFLGEEDLNDENHYKVRLTKKDGTEMVFYFNEETSLPSQLKMLITEGRAKGSIMVLTFEDYKEVDGYMFAHSTDRILDGVSQGKYVISEIKINLEISDSEFKLPKN